MKYCQVGKHEVEKLWTAKGKDRLSACKTCADRLRATNTKKVVPAKPIAVRKPIKKLSEKQDKINKAYSVLRKQFLKDRPFCEVFAMDCMREATTVHHKLGRRGMTLDTEFWLACCMSCHYEIESRPEWAYAMGLSLKRLETT